ncbi:hypothetical protein GCM10029992_27380 [Glycomyces albus]
MRIARYLLASLVAAATVLAAVALTPAGGAAAGSVYYVAPNGNDGAAGTEAAPWRSFAHAQDVAEAGDTVYFRGGAYDYTNAAWNCSSQTDRVSAIVLDKSGGSGNPITYSAYPGETPVFDFSGMNDDCRIKGFEVTANRIHLKDWRSPACRRTTTGTPSPGASGSREVTTPSSSSTSTTSWGPACSSTAGAATSSSTPIRTRTSTSAAPTVPERTPTGSVRTTRRPAIPRTSSAAPAPGGTATTGTTSSAPIRP